MMKAWMLAVTAAVAVTVAQPVLGQDAVDEQARK